MTPFFSIIVVCLNPGEKLLQTLQSIQKQEFRDYEIVLKDGGSTDGSLQKLYPEQSGLLVVTKPDRGIYDAMNQAVEEAKGRFVFFLNCGMRLAELITINLGDFKSSADSAPP